MLLRLSSVFPSSFRLADRFVKRRKVAVVVDRWVLGLCGGCDVGGVECGGGRGAILQAGGIGMPCVVKHKNARAPLRYNTKDEEKIVWLRTNMHNVCAVTRINDVFDVAVL